MEVKVIGNDSSATEITVNASEDGFKGLIDALKKDGLAPAGKLTIEYKDGKFSINGKEQSVDVLKKYETYLNGKKSINITLDESVEKK